MTEKLRGIACSRRERERGRFPRFQKKLQWLESDL